MKSISIQCACACCKICELMTDNDGKPIINEASGQYMCIFGGPYIGYQDKDKNMILIEVVKNGA